jgi:tetratricopeptide (TPR) repeat protein
MSDTGRVYVAYAPDDEGWAQSLAEALESQGLHTFVRAWDVLPGSVTVHEVDSAMRDCGAAVVVLSPASHSIREYPALTEQADLGGMLLVPVLLAGAVVPQSLSGRERVDFGGVASRRDFDSRVAALAGALRGEPVVRRSFAGLDFDRVAEGPMFVRLRLSRTESILVLPSGSEVGTPHTGTGPVLRQLLWDASLARRAADRRADLALARLGKELGRQFLAEPVGAAVAGLVAAADERNKSLRLGIEVHPDAADLADLPWECVIAPGVPTPLALHPRVHLHRHADLGPTVRPDVPGPLRILAVVASPDHGGRELLDYEHELDMILERVDVAFRGQAYVRILNWGSVGAIREALTEERFHVLHLSCHAAPGVLLLETADGGPDPVDARRLADELVVPERDVPLVVLAGCSTALSVTTTTTQEQLPSLAQTLLAHGVPAVLAMTAPVTDIYATELLSMLYGQLARPTAPPDPLTTLSHIRRALESTRGDRAARDPLGQLPEWPTAAYFSRVGTTTLYERSDRAQRSERSRHVRVADGIVDLDDGEFVGRRVDLRRLLRALRGDRAHERGVLIHGIGGVGKSSLAVQLVRMLATDRTVVVSLYGRCTADKIMTAVASRLLAGLPGTDELGSDDEVRALRRRLRDTENDWPERLELLADRVMGAGVEVLLLLDDPLGDPWRDSAASRSGPIEGELDSDLSRFLEAWLRIRRGARLVVTARRADALSPSQAALRVHHLGPLSRAEARKLYWRLPAVYALPDDERERAYQDLGGHPRALEYLDALLRDARGDPGASAGARGGARPFHTIADRMRAVLRGNGVPDPAVWMRAAGRDTDMAIAEVVAETSADVLLDAIVQRLGESFPEARELLVAASVYRRPVDPQGLTWVVTAPRAPAPERTALARRCYKALRRLRRTTTAPTLDDLPLAATQRTELNRDMAVLARPDDVPWLDEARSELSRLGLLSPAGDGRWMVHRWTAAALARSDAAAVRRAHPRAAAYRRWWAGLHATDRSYDYADLEEARYHCAAAQDLDQLVSVAAELCTVLHARSALRQEELVCVETIEQIGDDHPQTWFFRHQLGVIEMWRGRYDAAEAHHRRCLDLAKSRRDTLDEATSLRELGAVAQLRGDVEAARRFYKQAMERCYEPGVRDSIPALTVLAACYQQLGGIDLARENGEAWRWSEGALNIAEELAGTPGTAATERDLARLARAFGNAAAADEHEIKASESIAVEEDLRRLMATSALLTGAVQLLRSAPEAAVDGLRRALGAATDLDDGPLYAYCLQLLGDVLFELGQFEEAARTYRQFAELADELGDPVRQAIAEQQLGRVAIEDDPSDATGLASSHFEEAIAISSRLGNQALMASTYLFRGEAASRGGDGRAARDYLREALSLAEVADAPAIWIAGAIHLGRMEARAGHPDAAAGWFEQALKTAMAAGNRRAVISCLTAIGLLDRENGRPGAARRRLSSAVATAREGGHRRTAAKVLLHLGRIESDAGDRKNAERWYGEIPPLLAAGIDTDLLAETYRQRGRLRVVNEAWEDAIPDLRHALELYRAREAAGASVWCLLYLHRAYVMTGDDGAAAETGVEAGDIAATLGDSMLRVVGLLTAGEERLDSGNPRAATARFESAVTSAIAIERPPAGLVAECRRGLARAAQASGDPLSAAHQQEQVLAIAIELQDRIAAMHDLRNLGRAYRDAGLPKEAARRFVGSATAAAELNDHAAVRAAEIMLSGLSGSRGLRPDNSPEVAAVEARWRDLRWLRRTRYLDGERPFVDDVSAYSGSSVDHVLRDMSSKHSALTGVPLVVRPHRVRHTARPS